MSFVGHSDLDRACVPNYCTISSFLIHSIFRQSKNADFTAMQNHISVHLYALQAVTFFLHNIHYNALYFIQLQTHKLINFNDK